MRYDVAVLASDSSPKVSCNSDNANEWFRVTSLNGELVEHITCNSCFDRRNDVVCALLAADGEVIVDTVSCDWDWDDGVNVTLLSGMVLVQNGNLNVASAICDNSAVGTLNEY